MQGTEKETGNCTVLGFDTCGTNTVCTLGATDWLVPK